MKQNKNQQYGQANRDWLVAKSKEGGVKALPKGIFYKVLAEGDATGATPTPGRPRMTETSNLVFYRYDNAKERMVGCEPPGFELITVATMNCHSKARTSFPLDGTTTAPPSR